MLGDVLGSVLGAIPTDWIEGIFDAIKGFGEVLIDAVKLAFAILQTAAEVAIDLAAGAVSFFGSNIYSEVPGLREVRYPPRPDPSVRARIMAERRKSFEKVFKIKLNVFTEQIDVLIDRRRAFKLAKNLEGYKNVTQLLKKKANERDVYKRWGYLEFKKYK